jgi:Glycosyl transferase family 2
VRSRERTFDDPQYVTSCGASTPRIAVLVPCYNEAPTIHQVVTSFRAALPSARIFVYDNNSRDGTGDIARTAGAVVRQETRQGKGYVVRRMFADVDADVFVLVDGDGTYDASAAPMLISTLLNGQLDFVNAARVSTSREAYRTGHRFGNWLLTHLVKLIFGRQLRDMLSGYKVLSRRFVKSFPAMSRGFETETELAVHALELRMPSQEVDTNYKERPPGSASKLRTWRDGTRILMLIAQLVKEERPFQFFGLLGAGLALASTSLGIPLVLTFLETGLVPRFPTAILATGLMVLGMLSFMSGLVLDMTTRTRQEMKRLFYLSIPALPRPNTS